MTDNVLKPQPAVEALHHPGTRLNDVIRYWASLRDGNEPPRRSQIEAAALAQALPDVFLAEIITPRIARFRLCGHRIEDLMGMDMRGMPLTVLFQGGARQEIADALEQVALGARVMLSLQGESGFGLPSLSASLALLPLTDDSGRITRILGVIDRTGTPGRCPRRFTLAGPQTLPRAPRAPAAPVQPVLRVINGGKG